MRLFPLLLLISTTSATRFLFGVDLKCNINNKTFKFTISHWDNVNNVKLTDEKTLIGKKHLFFYQDGFDNLSGGYFYEPYALIQHNCTLDGGIVGLKHELGRTLRKHGLEFKEYSVSLMKKSQKGT